LLVLSVSACAPATLLGAPGATERRRPSPFPSVYAP